MKRYAAKIKKLIRSLGILATLSVISPKKAHAQNLLGCTIGDPPQLTDITCLAVNVVTVTIWTGAGIAAISIVISGIKLAAAKGDPKAINQAKQIMTWSIAGLLITLLAVTIVRLIGRTVLGISGFTPRFILPRIN